MTALISATVIKKFSLEYIFSLNGNTAIKIFIQQEYENSKLMLTLLLQKSDFCYSAIHLCDLRADRAVQLHAGRGELARAQGAQVPAQLLRPAAHAPRAHRLQQLPSARLVLRRGSKEDRRARHKKTCTGDT